MRYVLLIVTASLQKVELRACWHIWFISLWPWVVNHLDYVSPCLAYTLPFIFVCVHVTAAPLVVILIDMPPTYSSRLPLVYVSVNGSDSARVWAEKPSRERTGSVCVCWCVVVIKFWNQEHPSILAGDLRHWRGRVSAAAAWPTNQSANLSVSLTPGNRSFPLFIRSDLYFL